MENFSPVDPVDFIKALNRERVPYLLIGRQALVQYGAPVQSMDYDFFIAPGPEALQKLLKAVQGIDVEIYPDPPQTALKLTMHADRFKADVFRARVYTLPDGRTFSFDEMYGRKNVFGDKDFSVTVPSLEDLRLTKLLRSLPKDLEDLKYIDTLLEERRRPKKRKG